MSLWAADHIVFTSYPSPSFLWFKIQQATQVSHKLPVTPLAQTLDRSTHTRVWQSLSGAVPVSLSTLGVSKQVKTSFPRDKIQDNSSLLAIRLLGCQACAEMSCSWRTWSRKNNFPNKGWTTETKGHCVVSQSALVFMEADCWCVVRGAN